MHTLFARSVRKEFSITQYFPSFRVFRGSSCARTSLATMSSQLRSDSKTSRPSRIQQDLKGYSTSTSSGRDTGIGSTPKMSSSNWRAGQQPHVIVIGAGVSGLRCAEVLLEGGVQVTMLEARGRIGGRVHQIEQGGHLLDMGANWIHGTVNNPILDIAKKTGTVTSSISERMRWYNEYGCQIFNESKAMELHDLVWGIISDAFKYSHEHGASCAPSKSLFQFMEAELQKRDLPAEDYRTALYMAEQWGHYIGDHYSLQSLKYFWLEENVEGENLFVAGSYQKILNQIARRAQTEASIILNRRVSAIGSVLNAQPPRVKVYSRDTHSQEELISECDAVVITVPLGCLKMGYPAIHPKPAPLAITAAIKSLGYGSLEKAYFTFPTAWWSTGPEAPHFSEFLHPLYDNENPYNAILDCMDLSLMPDESAQPTLLFYFHGPLASSLVKDLEQFEHDEAEAEKFLIRRFRPYFSLLPNFDPDETACVPVAASMTRWKMDPYAGGSYTNFPISAMRGTPEGKMDQSIEALRHGIPERNIYFAGEHTSPFAAVGTVTGAYWSGERVAERILVSFRGDGPAAPSVKS